MITYKGFDKQLRCTRGRGVYQYQIGRKEKTQKADCMQRGFHSCENPLDTFFWYENGRYCACVVGGDIHESGDQKISSTEITPIKELSKEKMVMLGCEYMRTHPYMPDAKCVKKEEGKAEKGEILIVRGKHPKGQGEKGSTIFLLQEKVKSKEIKQICVIENPEPGIWYTVEEAGR